MLRFRTLGAMSILAIGLTTACEDSYVDPLPRPDQLDWPIGLQVHPNGRYLYAVNSNFDTRYSEAFGGTISVFDLEHEKLLTGNGPFIPSFGGQIKLNDDATKAYVTVRFDNQILALDVAENGSALGCKDGQGRLTSELDTCRIRRVPAVSDGALMPSDPFGLDVVTVQNSRTNIAAQDGIWTVSNGTQSADVDATGLSDATLATRLAAAVRTFDRLSASAQADLLSITGDDGQTLDLQITRPDQSPVEFTIASTDVLGVSHLRGTQLTAISVPDQVTAAASMRSAEFIPGSNDVERRPGTRDFYAAGRLSRELAIFQPYLAADTQQVEAIVDRGRVSLNHLTSAVDARALAFEPDGKTLYVATRNPDALHIVEITTANPETGSGTTHRVVDSIPLERNPSDIVRLQIGNHVRLYIPCYEAGVVQVVDPATRRLVDEIELGASPYIMAIDQGANCQPGSGQCLGYVSLFDDLPRAGGRCDSNREEPCGSIGVIDLNPDSPRYHTLIRKLY